MEGRGRRKIDEIAGPVLRSFPDANLQLRLEAGEGGRLVLTGDRANAVVGELQIDIGGVHPREDVSLRTRHEGERVGQLYLFPARR